MNSAERCYGVQTCYINMLEDNVPKSMLQTMSLYTPEFTCCHLYILYFTKLHCIVFLVLGIEGLMYERQAVYHPDASSLGDETLTHHAKELGRTLGLW